MENGATMDVEKSAVSPSKVNGKGKPESSDVLFCEKAEKQSARCVAQWHGKSMDRARYPQQSHQSRAIMSWVRWVV